jgi:hypothetical protein
MKSPHLFGRSPFCKMLTILDQPMEILKLTWAEGR